MSSKFIRCFPVVLRLPLLFIPLLILSLIIAEAEYATITMVSMTDNMPGNSHSGHIGIDITSDGRYIVYSSAASNLVSEDNFNCPDNGDYVDSDIFVYDRMTQQNSLMTVSTEGVQGTVTGFGYYGCISKPSISDDGRFVVFGSITKNLAPGDNNSESDLFLHDRDFDEDGIFDEPGAISTIRINPANAAGGLMTSDISGDGRYIAFKYRSGKGAMVYDRLTGESIDIETAADGTPGNILNWISFVTISDTGRFVAFISRSDNLVPGDTNAQPEIFLRDRDPDNNGIFDEPGLITVEQVLLTNQGIPPVCPSCDYYQFSDLVISGDGQSVAFGFDRTLIDGISGKQIYVRDRKSQSTVLISKALNGTAGNKSSSHISINGDGRFIVFASEANNLLFGQTTSTDIFSHVFIHDRDVDHDGHYDEPGAFTTALVSGGLDGIHNGGGYKNAINDDGSVVVFASSSDDLINNDPVICPTSSLVSCSDIFMAVPAPLSPTNLTAEIISNNQIDLSWTDNATDETEYDIERRKHGESIWTEVAVLAANTVTYTDHDFSCDIYEYRVKAYRNNDRVFSHPSDVVIVDGSSCNEAIILVSPLNEETVTIYPTLKWVGYPEATSYKILIHDFSGKSIFNLVLDANYLCSGGSCSLNLATQNIQLISIEKYEWRIQAKGDFGKVKSPIRAFNTNFAVPGAFILLSPPSDSIIDTLTPILSWQQSINAEEYRIQIKDSIDDTKMLKLNLPIAQVNCANGICSIDSSMFIYRHTLENGNRYVWRIKARNSLGRVKSSKWLFDVNTSGLSGRPTPSPSS